MGGDGNAWHLKCKHSPQVRGLFFIELQGQSREAKFINELRPNGTAWTGLKEIFYSFTKVERNYPDIGKFNRIYIYHYVGPSWVLIYDSVAICYALFYRVY